jgi:hypothetical protein
MHRIIRAAYDRGGDLLRHGRSLWPSRVRAHPG